MTRSRIILLIAAAALAGCNASDATAPAAASPRLAAPASQAPSFTIDPDDLHDGHVVPGSIGNAGSAPATGQQTRLACNIVAPLSGSATIGPEGGLLYVGRNLLIVPPGALTQPVTLSGTVPTGNQFLIDFQPHGLQFKKPAGLVLDMSSCGTAPNVVYLDEQGGILQRITAIFSNWWHVIAAPLDHFSTYAVDV